jgi:hypothetical protein
MADDETPPTQQAPDCERCGTRTYPSTRTMRMHDISTGRAIPRDEVYPVWRCPSCGREAPRT